MNKKSIRIAGWALGLSMAVAGIGIAVGASKAPMETKAASDGTMVYTPSAKDAGTFGTDTSAAPAGLTATFLNTYNNKNQITGGNSMTLTISAAKGYTYSIDAITISARTNKTKGAGTATATIGGEAIGSYTYTVIGDSYADKAFTMDAEAVAANYLTNGKALVITISCTTSSVYCERFDISYTAIADDPTVPSVAITNENKIAPHGVARPLSAAITNDDDYTITWACANPNVTLSSTTGANITVTASDEIAAGTVITVTATLNDSGSASDSTSFYVASKAGDSVANALPAGEAATLVATGDFDGDTIYVKGYSNNSGAKYVWLSDNPDTEKTFEVYNADGLSSYTNGTFIVAHGSALKYKSTTHEIQEATVDSADYFSLSASSTDVDLGQFVDITASGATGDIVWTTTNGTGSVSLSNESNTGVRITGTAIGTATVTATLGNLVKNIPVTVNSYATDWVYKDITLVADGSFKTVYEVGEELDLANLTVTYIEYSATLDEDRETVVTTDPGCSFNFDSSAAGSFNLTATYNEHTTDDVIGITVKDGPAYNLAFGTDYESVFTTTTAESVTGAETKYETKSFDGLEWTLKTVSGNTKNVRVISDKALIQVGTSDNPATEFSIRSNVFGEAKTKVTSVKVMTYGAAGTSAATLSVTSDDGSFACNSNPSVAISGTTKPTNAYEFVSTGAYGHVSINFASVAKGIKIESIVIYAEADATDKGLAYAFASRLESVSTCDESSKDALITAYNSLSPEVKAIADTINLYDRPAKGDEDYGETYKSKTVTVATKMAYIIANNSAGSGLGSVPLANNQSNSSLPLIISIVGVGVLASAGLFVLQRKRKEHK